MLFPMPIPRLCRALKAACVLSLITTATVSLLGWQANPDIQVEVRLEPGFPTRTQLARARQALDDGRYLTALETYGRCLLATRADAFEDLHECLYLGEQAAVGLAAWGERGANDAEYAGALVGVHIYEGHYGRNYYDHAFFRSLKDLFPHTPHLAEVDYRLIDFGARHEGDYEVWKEWLSALDTYLLKHPAGPFATRASQTLRALSPSPRSRPARRPREAYGVLVLTR